MIWTDDYLSLQWDNAERDAAGKIPISVITRCSLEIVSGQSIYVLGHNLNFRNIMRITYRGRKLEPVSYPELQALDPTGASPMEPVTATGAPYYYCRWPSSYSALRLYPTPSEDLDANEEMVNFGKGSIDQLCVITAYCIPDPTSDLFKLPRWIARRLKKYYVIATAFARDGKGQNLKAAEYFMLKYLQEIEIFKQINAGCFITKKHILVENTGGGYNIRPHRPVLPANFPRT